MSKFSNLPLHAHESCKTIMLARDAENREAWEARYCFDHDLKYKIQLFPDSEPCNCTCHNPAFFQPHKEGHACCDIARKRDYHDQ